MTDLIFAIPFHNEEARLPGLFESLACAQVGHKFEIVMANHLSDDDSLKIIKLYEPKFGRVVVINEEFPVNCGGIPRNTAFKTALKLADEYKLIGKNVPIATIDCDTKVSIKFCDEISNHLNKGFDVITFPDRYDQSILQEWVSVQDESTKETSTHSLIGLSWLRHELLWGLILSGIIETRGPGGYAMNANTLRLLDHKQPFDENGKPITGENNQLGIRANNIGLKVYGSPYQSQVHPRREMASYSKNNFTDKGYSKNSLGSEVFGLSRGTNFPILDSISWLGTINLGINRSLKMVLTRAACYKRFDAVSNFFIDSTWQKMINNSKEFMANQDGSTELLSITGSHIYNNMFDYVINRVGKKEIGKLISKIELLIPDNGELIKWSENDSQSIMPSNLLIRGLQSKYLEKYV